MAGETDLELMLATLQVERRAGTFAYVAVPTGTPLPADLGLAGLVREAEGDTWIVDADEARAHGLTVTFEAAWLTVRVHSSLDAVGLTAALSGRLAVAGIPANLLAGTYHDHVLVPVDDAERAAAVLTTVT